MCNIILWACLLCCQIKSSAAQDALSDCLTVHQLQTTLSPLPRTDLSLNSPPNAFKESRRGTSPPSSVTGGGKQHWKRFCGRRFAVFPQGCSSSTDPRLALLRSMADSYRCGKVIDLMPHICIHFEITESTTSNFSMPLPATIQLCHCRHFQICERASKTSIFFSFFLVGGNYAELLHWNPYLPN